MNKRIIIQDLISDTGQVGNVTVIGDDTPAPTVLVPKTITENGTYDPADDEADGYSSVEVEVATGGYTLSEIATGAGPSGDIVIEDDKLRHFVFAFTENIGKVSTTKTLISGSNIFQKSSVTEFVGIKLTSILGSSAFEGCSSLKKFVVPNATYFDYRMCFLCNNLEVADIGGGAIVRGDVFKNCTMLGTIIIRSNTLCTLGGISNLEGTPFASGGSGGTIYIPETLYDHLGDGTSLDYKAATNWSTLDGYGTVTWAKIEGSQYENAYADGTPIS